MKCHQYWPEGKETHRDVTVTLHKSEIFPDYAVRTFFLTHKVGLTWFLQTETEFYRNSSKCVEHAFGFSSPTPISLLAEAAKVDPEAKI